MQVSGNFDQCEGAAGMREARTSEKSQHPAGRTGAPCSAIKAVDSDAAKGHVAQRRANGFDHVRKLRAFR